MYGDAANVVYMGLENLDLLHGVVVVATDVHVIGTDDDPLLPWHEDTASHGLIRNFKRFYDAASLVVVDEDMAVVHRRENPWLGGMDVDALDALRSLAELLLNI